MMDAVDFAMENWHDNVYMQLVNTERNQKELANMPSRLIGDVSVVYKILIEKNMTSNVSIRVTDNVMQDYMCIEEPELYNIAMENTKRLFPAKILPMQEMFTEMIGLCPSGDIVPKEEQMYVVTTEVEHHGAVAVLYDELHDLAEKLNSELYILPSSIHECLAVSAKIYDPDELEQMVQSVNGEVVVPEEQLSNKVYFYSRNERKLVLAEGKQKEIAHAVEKEEEKEHKEKNPQTQIRGRCGRRTGR